MVDDTGADVVTLRLPLMLVVTGRRGSVEDLADMLVDDLRDCAETFVDVALEKGSADADPDGPSLVEKMGHFDVFLSSVADDSEQQELDLMASREPPSEGEGSS